MGAFDDLIPAAKQQAGAFDDLIPQQSADPAEGRRAEYDAQIRREMEMSPEEFERHNVELVKKGYPHRAQPGSFVGSTFANKMFDPFGVRDEMRGAGAYVGELVRSGLDLDRASDAYEKASEITRAEQRVGSEKHGILPEIIGGFGTSGVSSAISAAPSFLRSAGQAAKVGATSGGVAGFTQSEGGIGNRLLGAGKGAAAGAVIGPAISNVAIPAVARIAGGVKDGVRYANRTVAQARNPEQAAYQSVADEMVKGNVAPADVRAAIAPQPSANLRSRMTPAGQPFNEGDMAEVVSRSMRGDTAEAIAADYGLHPSTVRRYVTTWQANNPTPRNIIDVAKETYGSGGAQPLSNLGRSTMAISDDPVAAERLIQRQVAQPGRVADIVQQSGVQGRNFEDEIQRLATTARGEERAAYAAARQSAQPVNLRGVIRRWRGRRPQEGGEINNSVNRAVDMFFRGGMAENAGGNIRYRKINDLVDDLPTFLERRRELDQMVARSMQDGQNTPLTSELTRLRTDLNNAARRNNPALQDADARFSGNRTSERLLEEGAELGKRLTPRSRQALREFNDMTPSQQEIFRVGFERRMADDALNVRRGAAAANQFSGEGFSSIINRLYPRSAGREIHQRGQNLIRDLRREAISTETTRDLLSGSRTAPMSDDMAEQMEAARAAADAITGRFSKIVENLSNKLTRQIGQRAASEKVRILTETDPARMLPMLNRLAQAAQTTAERQAYVATARELRATSLPGVSAVSGQSAGRSQAQK